MRKKTKADIHLKNLENYENWIVENSSLLKDIDTASSTLTELNSSEDDGEINPFKTLEDIIRASIKDDNKPENFQLIFHEFIKTAIRQLKKLNIISSILINAVTMIYLRILFQLKSKDPEQYASLNPYQQFSRKTFKFIGAEITKDYNFVEIIDSHYWKEKVYEEISESEEIKALRHSIRSLILYIESIRNRQKRLINLKK